MNPYVVTMISNEDYKLFEKIEKIVQEMPDIDFSEQKRESRRKVLLSCHMIARALATFFPLQYHDGYCGDCEHSWLTTKTGNIIDAYPVGIMGGPILIPTGYAHPFERLYKENVLYRVSGIRFQRNVNKVIGIMEETMTKLDIKRENSKKEMNK